MARYGKIVIVGSGDSEQSALEKEMAWNMRVAKIPFFETQWKFWPGRKYAFDFAWPDRLLALEVEGGTFSGGRHTRGPGFEEDCRKYNKAIAFGWRVLRVTKNLIQDGSALQMVEEALAWDPEHKEVA